MKKLENNHWLCFFTYFAMNFMYIYTNTYLPIYFEYVFSLEKTKLSLVLLVSYSFMFTKPIVALIIDKNEKSNKQINMKTLLMTSFFSSIVSFIIFLLESTILPIFIIFLSINLAFISVLDVIIDKIIVQDNATNDIKDKNIFYTQLGVIVGAIMPNMYYFITIYNKSSANDWTVFFIIGACSLIPFLIMVSFANLNSNSKTSIKEVSRVIPKKTMGLICLFIFLSNSSQLYNWILEPWAIGKLGSASSLFSPFMIFFIILSAVGILVAKKKAREFDRIKTLMLVVIVDGFLISFAPYLNIILFMFLISITQFIIGFYYINLTFIMINISKREVLIFQIMSIFSIAARVVFIPLGTFLSSTIPAELVITIAGIMYIISAIPVYYLRNNNWIQGSEN